jgi:hypothetical protein
MAAPRRCRTDGSIGPEVAGTDVLYEVGDGQFSGEMERFWLTWGKLKGIAIGIFLSISQRATTVEVDIDVVPGQ